MKIRDTMILLLGNLEEVDRELQSYLAIIMH